MPPVKILLTGATGYIGGDLLTELLKRPSDFEITVLIRGKDRASTFEKLGAKVIVGSQEDYDLLAKAASQVDVVIHTSDSSNTSISKAFLEGLVDGKSKYHRGGILIQTSGTGVVLEPTFGEFATEKVWSDLDLESISKLPAEAVHRSLDVFVSEYPQDIATTAIIFPSNVYGLGRGPYNKLSIINIALERAAVKYKKVYGIGKGANIWSSHHVSDLSAAYIKVLDGLLNGTADHGKEGFYFVESGEAPMKAVYEEIGNVLKQRGIIQDTTLVQMPDSVLTDTSTLPPFASEDPQRMRFAVGGSSRVKADRLRTLGWNPKYANPVGSIAEEIDYILQGQ